MLVPDRPPRSCDRLLLTLVQLLDAAQRVGAAGVRERASLAMLDALDFAEELGMIWGGEAGRWRAVVGEGFGAADPGSSKVRA